MRRTLCLPGEGEGNGDNNAAGGVVAVLALPMATALASVAWACNSRRILSQVRLLSQVCDQNLGVTPNVVEVYIAYLRKKVDAPGEPKLIRTKRGAGYALKGA
jgi:DNA-binding response OmpR family regulator